MSLTMSIFISMLLQNVGTSESLNKEKFILKEEAFFIVSKIKDSYANSGFGTATVETSR